MVNGPVGLEGRPSVQGRQWVVPAAIVSFIMHYSHPASGWADLNDQWWMMPTIQAELLAGGDSLPVTADNRLLYVHLLAELAPQCTAWQGGCCICRCVTWLPPQLNAFVSIE